MAHFMKLFTAMRPLQQKSTFLECMCQNCSRSCSSSWVSNCSWQFLLNMWFSKVERNHEERNLSIVTKAFYPLPSLLMVVWDWQFKPQDSTTRFFPSWANMLIVQRPLMCHVRWRMVWRTHFIKSVEGKEKNDHGFLEDPSHWVPWWRLCGNCCCAGTCMKYAYQQLCTITSTLEISYWMMSSIHNSRIVELQISPHLLQFHRYIYTHTSICICKDALECYDGVYVCIVVMVVIMGGCAGIAPTTTNAGISWV
jgi:hypothetical protein